LQAVDPLAAWREAQQARWTLVLTVECEAPEVVVAEVSRCSTREADRLSGVVVIDTAQLQPDGTPVVDWGIPIEVPYRCSPSSPSSPGAGTSTTRSSSSAMASSWRHGGNTDLDNLLPLCERHHHAVHDRGSRITLGPRRELTINLPDGTTLTTGPPSRNGHDPRRQATRSPRRQRRRHHHDQRTPTRSPQRRTARVARKSSHIADIGGTVADPYKPRAPFAPWDRRELPGMFDVEESARRVGNYKWAEMKLFEALGGWVATVPELDVKMRLGTHCYHHAWHAELWHKRLPELREMNPDRLTVPANEAMVRFVEALTEPEAPELTIEKLVGVYRVFIPHFIAAYTFHKNNTSQITDAPTIRSLTFILQDEFEDWRDGEMMIQSLLDSPDEVDRAAAHQAKLEKLMLAAGGIAGPGSIGAQPASAHGGS
jgi:hypothetical protein